MLLVVADLLPSSPMVIRRLVSLLAGTMGVFHHNSSAVNTVYVEQTLCLAVQGTSSDLVADAFSGIPKSLRILFGTLGWCASPKG